MALEKKKKCTNTCNCSVAAPRHLKGKEKYVDTCTCGVTTPNRPENKKTCTDTCGVTPVQPPENKKKCVDTCNSGVKTPYRPKAKKPQLNTCGVTTPSRPKAKKQQTKNCSVTAPKHLKRKKPQINACTRIKHAVLAILNVIYDRNKYVSAILRITLSILIIYYVLGTVVLLCILIHYTSTIHRVHVSCTPSMRARIDAMKCCRWIFALFPLYTSIAQMTCIRFRRKHKRKRLYEIRARDNQWITFEMFGRNVRSECAALIVHGLNGSSGTKYVRNLAYKMGMPVVCLNWRGVRRRTRTVCHVGSVEDVLVWMGKRWEVCVVGYSLGGARLAKVLGMYEMIHHKDCKNCKDVKNVKDCKDCKDVKDCSTCKDVKDNHCKDCDDHYHCKNPYHHDNHCKNHYHYDNHHHYDKHSKDNTRDNPLNTTLSPSKDPPHSNTKTTVNRPINFCTLNDDCPDKVRNEEEDFKGERSTLRMKDGMLRNENDRISDVEGKEGGNDRISDGKEYDRAKEYSRDKNQDNRDKNNINDSNDNINDSKDKDNDNISDNINGEISVEDTPLEEILLDNKLNNNTPLDNKPNNNISLKTRPRTAHSAQLNALLNSPFYEHDRKNMHSRTYNALLHTKIRCCIGICVPFNLPQINKSLTTFPRSLIQPIIFNNYRSFLKKNRITAFKESKTLAQYNSTMARIHGYADTNEYLRANSCERFVPYIRVPTLFVVGEDDVIVPRCTVDVEGLCTDYVGVWCMRGGHMAFIDNWWESYCDEIVLEFMRVCMKE